MIKKKCKLIERSTVQIKVKISIFKRFEPNDIFIEPFFLWLDLVLYNGLGGGDELHVEKLVLQVTSYE